MKKRLIVPLAFVLGIAATLSVIVMVGAASANSPEAPKGLPVFPSNSSGETYGSVLELTNLEDYPDLISAVGEGGIEGYIRQSEADPWLYGKAWRRLS